MTYGRMTQELYLVDGDEKEIGYIGDGGGDGRTYHEGRISKDGATVLAKMISNNPDSKLRRVRCSERDGKVS